MIEGLLTKAERIVNACTMYALSEMSFNADWVMSLIDEYGYPSASMITASRADGFKWIAFCTMKGSNKPKRVNNDSRTCVYKFNEKSFTGISLLGKTEVVTDLDVKRQMWYDALADHFQGPEDDNLCVLVFRPERYNIFIDGRTIRGAF